MRVTENTINRRVLRDINSSLQRLDRNYLELSSGKRLHYPSDDPVSLTISLKLRNGLREMEQYKKNAENAIAWLEVTDTLFDELSKVMHRLKEIAVNGANSVLPAECHGRLGGRGRRTQEPCMADRQYQV